MKNITLPTIALRSMTVLPGMVIHFDISRKKSIKAVEKAVETNQKLFLVAQKDSRVAEPKENDLYNVGTVASVKQLIKMPDGVVRVLVEGLKRGTICRVSETDGYLLTDIVIDDVEITEPDELTSRAMVMSLDELIRQYAYINPKLSRDIVNRWLSVKSAKELIEKVLIDYPMSCSERQHFLELTDIEVIYEELAKLIIEDINVGRIKEELTER